MAIESKTTDFRRFKLINTLRKLASKKKDFLQVKREIARTGRNRPEVNLWQLEKKAKDQDFVLVPGKVLGEGVLTKKINVVAYSFSQKAKDLIKKSGGKTFLIEEFVDKNKDQEYILVK